MAGNRQKVQMEEAEALPERLCSLLTEQIAWARQGNMTQVERLGARVDVVIARMAQGPVNSPVIAESQRARLKQQYDELVLTLRAERADVQSKVKQLRQVKRVVGACNRRKRR